MPEAKSGKKAVLKHYLAEVKVVLHEVPLSVIYFLLVNFPLLSLFRFCCVFFLSSTFFHVRYISVYKKTSIGVAVRLEFLRTEGSHDQVF